jgi:hypothetical protein
VYTPLARATVLDRKRALVSEAVPLVVRASGLIETPSRWTRDHWALDSRGREVPLTSPQAARYCLLGAVYRAEHELHGTVIPAVEWDAVDFGGHWPLRLELVVQGLYHHCRRELSRRFGIEFVVPSGERTEAPVIVWHELPAAYNSTSSLGHKDVQRALGNVLAILLFLQFSDEALRKYLRLPKRRQW